MGNAGFISSAVAACMQWLLRAPVNSVQFDAGIPSRKPSLQRIANAAPAVITGSKAQRLSEAVARTRVAADVAWQRSSSGQYNDIDG